MSAGTSSGEDEVVYCKDDDRRGDHSEREFDFLGYTFRPRRSKNRKGKYFINFSPAVSDKAVKAMGRHSTMESAFAVGQGYRGSVADVQCLD